MIRWIRLTLLASAPAWAVLLASAPAWAQQDAPTGSPTGDWLTEDHEGVIRITACGPALCGTIVGMAQTAGKDGAPSRDVKGRPECGLEILHDATLRPDGKWFGHITDPDDGSDWHCAVWVDARDRLHLRGFVIVPLLGQTQIWTRYHGALTTDCAMT